MKLPVTVFLVSLCASAICGCEYHDRLRARDRARQEAHRRRSGLSALSAEDHMHELGRHHYQQDPRRGHLQALEDVRSSVHRPRPDYYRPVQSQLPAGTYICPGSDIYYCKNEATCVRNVDGSYKCQIERSYNVDEPVVSRQHGTTHHTGSRRYYPTVRHDGSHTSTRRVYPYRPRTNYYYGSRTCTSGERRVNITSTRWRCEDIDECVTENPCEQTCRNTQGSFYCLCDRGYKRDGEFACVDRDECTEYPTICDFGCLNNNGSYKCMCPEGYVREGEGYCAEIDECETSDPCDADKLCFNLWGSYECEYPETCPVGYARSDTSELDGACIIKNATASDGLPNAISFRKLAIEAKKTVGLSRLGSMTFRSGLSDDYEHSYDIDVLEGTDKIRCRRKWSSDSKLLIIEFYNRVPLETNVRIPYVMLITDTPRRKASRYGYRYYGDRYYGSRSYERFADPLPTKRKIVITFVPMIHGNKDE